MKWFIPAVVVLVLEAGFLFSVAALPEGAAPVAAMEDEVVVTVHRDPTRTSRLHDRGPVSDRVAGLR